MCAGGRRLIASNATSEGIHLESAGFCLLNSAAHRFSDKRGHNDSALLYVQYHGSTGGFSGIVGIGGWLDFNGAPAESQFTDRVRSAAGTTSVPIPTVAGPTTDEARLSFA